MRIAARAGVRVRAPRRRDLPHRRNDAPPGRPRAAGGARRPYNGRAAVVLAGEEGVGADEHAGGPRSLHLDARLQGARAAQVVAVKFP